MPTREPAETSIRRLFVLLCGFEILPKSISTRDRGARFILSEPVCAYLLDTDCGWVLLDTGLHPRNGCDMARRQQKFWQLGMTAPVIRDEHLLERQLADIGVGVGDIGHVILSHLHYDHAGNLQCFRHARISVQRREHVHAFGSRPGMAYFHDEYADARLQWDLRDGDWEAQPGLHLLDTRGHTPGHQSAVVRLRETGTIVLPFDAADMQENFDDNVLPGESCDDAAAARAIQRLKAIAAETRALTLFFHDPVAIQAMRLGPACYR